MVSCYFPPSVEFLVITPPPLSKIGPSRRGGFKGWRPKISDFWQSLTIFLLTNYTRSSRARHGGPEGFPKGCSSRIQSFLAFPTRLPNLQIPNSESATFPKIPTCILKLSSSIRLKPTPRFQITRKHLLDSPASISRLQSAQIVI